MDSVLKMSLSIEYHTKSDPPLVHSISKIPVKIIFDEISSTGFLGKDFFDRISSLGFLRQNSFKGDLFFRGISSMGLHICQRFVVETQMKKFSQIDPVEVDRNFFKGISSTGFFNRIFSAEFLRAKM